MATAPAGVIASRSTRKQVGPLHRPVVRVLGPIEQPVDQLGPLVGALVRQEGSRLRGGRQRADGVEIDAAQEGCVVGQVGWAECRGACRLSQASLSMKFASGGRANAAPVRGIVTRHTVTWSR